MERELMGKQHSSSPRSNTSHARITQRCRACGDAKIVNATHFRVIYTGQMDGWRMYSSVCCVCESRYHRTGKASTQ